MLIAIGINLIIGKIPIENVYLVFVSQRNAKSSNDGDQLLVSEGGNGLFAGLQRAQERLAQRLWGQGLVVGLIEHGSVPFCIGSVGSLGCPLGGPGLLTHGVGLHGVDLIPHLSLFLQLVFL
jgi:hypothetical protein